ELELNVLVSSERFRFSEPTKDPILTDLNSTGNRPMTTNSNATSKILTLLLAAVALACTVPPVWAKDQVPFRGSAEGAIASALPDPGGVLLTVLAEGKATHLGRFSREEMVLFNP